MIDERLARQIIESSGDFAIITLSADGLITSWNPGAEALLGWSADEVIGQHGRIIFTEEDQAAGSPEDEMSRSDIEGRALDERFHLKVDGSRFWGSGLMMPLLEAGGEPSGGYVKIVRDRTIEREAEMRFLTLADAMPGFVFVTDTDGHNVEVNARFQEYTGLGEADLLGDGWLQTVHPDSREAARQAWLDAVGTGSGYQSSIKFRDDKGGYRTFSCRAVPERSPDGRILRWIGTCVDVESETQARTSLEGLNLTLEHAVTERTAELARSYDILKAEIGEREKIEEALRQSQKMEAIGQLTGGVAHDFNNLLTVIRGSVDLLRRPDLPAEKRARYLEAIAETAERATALTGQLLAFARRQPLKAERFDVAGRLDTTRGVLDSLSGPAVNISFDIRCAPCVIEADPVQFDTAVVNMVVNARDAMDASGDIAIIVEEVHEIPAVRGHASVEGRFIAISVADTGTGIDPDQLGRIFEPFFTTKDVGKGTGLGLSQVFGFAKQSGGDITVTSEPDEGANFTLYLPGAKHEAAPQETEADTTKTTVSGGPGGCVLLVEDNQLVGDFAAQLLADLGFSTVWVASGAEAIAAVEAEPDRFDVVFSDVVMPGITGIELAEQLRANFPDLPIVLTSGYSHVLVEEGAHGFELLRKPYTAEGLSKALRKAKRN